MAVRGGVVGSAASVVSVGEAAPIGSTVFAGDGAAGEGTSDSMSVSLGGLTPTVAAIIVSATNTVVTQMPIGLRICTLAR